jgi:hypothetical protein
MNDTAADNLCDQWIENVKNNDKHVYHDDMSCIVVDLASAQSATATLASFPNLPSIEGLPAGISAATIPALIDRLITEEVSRMTMDYELRCALSFGELYLSAESKLSRLAAADGLMPRDDLSVDLKAKRKNSKGLLQKLANWAAGGSASQTQQ